MPLANNKNNMSTTENLVLVSFFKDCGRSGDIQGLFITTKEKLMSSIGKTAYFGEILGKHSDVTVKLTEEDFEIKSEDWDFIDKLMDLLDADISGYNPLNYIDHDTEESEED
jgi:hypothetical protein